MFKYIKKKIKKLIYKLLALDPGPQVDELIKGGLKVGRNFNMQQGCIIDDSHYWHIEIGDDVTLAPRVHILAHDASTKLHLNYTKLKNVRIGNRVFIGAGSIIMPGVTIGDNVIVGAGSIVTKSVESNSVVAGNPAKFICTTFEYIEKQKNEMLNENCFGEEFTLRQNVSLEKRQEMQRVVEERGIGFVI